MRILELTNFSAGICGVFARVKLESDLLKKKGHQIMIFSSNIVKGTDKIASETDKYNGIPIMRFPAKKIGGESFMSWNFTKEALKFNPEIIIAHSYRHRHTIEALSIAEELRKKGQTCKVFLVTHAPFARKRSLKQSIAVYLYDLFIGRKTLNKFDKIIAITKWEIPYLVNLGLKKEKIKYIPNGVPDLYFDEKVKSKIKDKLLFLGRISPIKDISTLLRAIPLLKDKKIYLELVGPAEQEYLDHLKKIIVDLKIKDRIRFSPAIFDINSKIKVIDSAKIFVLPSKSEGMPQSLVEALARGKIVISSNNLGSSDLIHTGQNGFLFKVGNEKDLAEKIDLALSLNKNEINRMQRNAKSSVSSFRAKEIISKLESLF